MSDELVNDLRIAANCLRGDWANLRRERAARIDACADRLEAARSGDPSAQQALAQMLGMTPYTEDWRVSVEVPVAYRFPALPSEPKEDV